MTFNLPQTAADNPPSTNVFGARLGDLGSGLYAPAGTPKAVIDVINAEDNMTLDTAATKERILAIGNVALALTPAEFGRKSAEDFKHFGALIRARGICGD
jgi:tripartite-type tricarboxylate transporter receptor subunit TctC